MPVSYIPGALILRLPGIAELGKHGAVGWFDRIVGIVLESVVGVADEKP